MVRILNTKFYNAYIFTYVVNVSLDMSDWQKMGKTSFEKKIPQ